MATDAAKHTVPAGSDLFDPQGSDAALALTIHDIVPVANATDRNATLTAMQAAGRDPAYSPVIVDRGDQASIERNAGSGWQIIAGGPNGWSGDRYSVGNTDTTTTIAGATDVTVVTLTIPNARAGTYFLFAGIGLQTTANSVAKMTVWNGAVGGTLICDTRCDVASTLSGFFTLAGTFTVPLGSDEASNVLLNLAVNVTSGTPSVFNGGATYIKAFRL